jgi:predicted nucleic acid-binding protein
MAALTLDVSAALPLLDGRAQPQLKEAIGRADAVYAPGLYLVESANALWKYVKAGHLAAEAAAKLHGQARELIDFFIADEALFPEALDAACRKGHPVYDLLYLLTARRTASALLTVDKRLAALAKKMDIPLAV